MQVVLKIFNAINKLEKETGRRFTGPEIATATGLHRHTIAGLMKGKEDRTATAIVRFLKDHNVDVKAEDLFFVIDDHVVSTADPD